MLTFDPAAYERGLRGMKTLVASPDLIIPGHDPEVMSRFERADDGAAIIG